MFLTILLFAVGTGLTLWGARVWYVSDSQPPSNLDPRDIPHYRPGWWRKWRGALLVSVLGGGFTLYFCGLLWFGNYHNEHWVTCDISSVEELGGNKYRIQSSDCGTLDNVDTFWRMKFNSPSLQGQLKKDTRVELRVAGANVPDWGWYPNIVTIKNIIK